MTKALIICAGRLRSASTWQYNCVRLACRILQPEAALWWGYVEDYRGGELTRSDGGAHRLGRPENLKDHARALDVDELDIVKLHARPQFFRALQLAEREGWAAWVCTSFRHPLEANYSASKIFNREIGSEFIERYCKAFFEISDYCDLIIKCEDLYGDEKGMVERHVRALGEAFTPKTDKSTRSVAEEVMDELERIDTQADPGGVHDPNTLFHRNHRTSTGEPGYYLGTNEAGSAGEWSPEARRLVSKLGYNLPPPKAERKP